MGSEDACVVLSIIATLLLFNSRDRYVVLQATTFELVFAGSTLVLDLG